MTPSEYAEWLEVSLQVEIRLAIGEAAETETKRMRDKISPTRKLTRRAFRHRVKHRLAQSEIRIGLHFSRRYPVRGTDTQRLMVSLWQQNKHHFRPTLDNIINKRLRRI